MRVQFLRDYQQHKAGDVVEMDEERVDDLRQSAIVQLYHEPEKDEKKPAPKRARAKQR